MSVVGPSYQTANILDLPNEVLLFILKGFPTKQLIRLAPTCHHLHALVLRILHRRLELASQLGSHALYLECDPPSHTATWASRISCTSLGADGLQALRNEISQNRPRVGTIGEMSKSFSRFKPYSKGATSKLRRRHPAGDVPGSRTYEDPGRLENSSSDDTANADRAVSRTFMIDSDCLFSQLATSVYLGPHTSLRGFLLRTHFVWCGIIRVFREWLDQQRKLNQTSDQTASARHASAGDKSKAPLPIASAVLIPEEDPSILWINHSGCNFAGIKLRVEESGESGDVVEFSATDPDLAVTCRVEIEEVVIRTTHLLLKLEEAKWLNENATGRAFIFGPYLD